MHHPLRDAALARSCALPNGNATVQTTALPLDLSTVRGAFAARCELEISAPAVTTDELPDGETFTYGVYQAAAADFAGEQLLAQTTQTGAGGAGAGATAARVTLPSDVQPYLRLKVAGSSGAGDASGKSGKSGSLALVF